MSKETFEIVVVDGGAIKNEKSNRFRGERIFSGLERSRGEICIVVHPRSLLPKDLNQFLHELSRVQAKGHSWGACSHSFITCHWFLSWTSWYSNCIRGDLRSVFYLDHCWFLDQKAIQQLLSGPRPEVAIFEDSLICYRLRKLQKGFRLQAKTLTSAERFLKHGLLKQGLINQVAKIKFHFWQYFGTSKNTELSRTNQIYEGSLRLNERKPDV